MTIYEDRETGEYVVIHPVPAQGDIEACYTVCYLHKIGFFSVKEIDGRFLPFREETPEEIESWNGFLACEEEL